MASTQNINTPGNYYLEQRQYKEQEQYKLYKHSQYGEAVDTRMAGLGVTQGRLPRESLSNNSVQTESFLFGINSTNLVNPEPKFVPEYKSLRTANFYEQAPTIIPLPLVIEKNQRPFPVP